jgi:hypothetical protein
MNPVKSATGNEWHAGCHWWILPPVSGVNRTGGKSHQWHPAEDGEPNEAKSRPMPERRPKPNPQLFILGRLRNPRQPSKPA